MINLSLKLFTAVIFSPLILAILLVVMLFVFTIFHGKPISNISSSELAYFIGLIYVFGLSGAFFIGIPIYFLLKRYNYISYKYFLFSGFIGGWAILGFISVLDDDLPHVDSIVIFAVSGAIVSSCFWFLVVHMPLKVLKRKNESNL